MASSSARSSVLLTPGPSAPKPDRPRSGNRGRSVGLLIAVVVLLVVCVLSVGVGSRFIPPAQVLAVLLHPDDSAASTIVHELRVPRTVLGVFVGLALGMAGAVMQALTRNPLADPGLLGVNAGAAVAVVIGIGVFGAGTAIAYLPFAFVGAAAAAIIVYLIGSTGRSGATPVRLALAGVAVTAALSAVIDGLTLLDPATFDRYREWAVGSLSGRGTEVLWAVVPFIVAGAVTAQLLARALNAMALGEDTGRALGAHVGRTRVASGAAITVLAGAATAAAGPISFLGLAVPHAARVITGPDNRWVLAYTAVLAPTLLVAGDVLGRVVALPGEVGVGIVTAVIGGPVFIAMVRRRRVVRL